MPSVSMYYNVLVMYLRALARGGINPLMMKALYHLGVSELLLLQPLSPKAFLSSSFSPRFWSSNTVVLHPAV
jgi:hypothetical protein